MFSPIKIIINRAKKDQMIEGNTLYVKIMLYRQVHRDREGEQEAVREDDRDAQEQEKELYIFM